MFRSIWFRWLLTCIIVTCFLNVPAWPQQSLQNDRWGFGILIRYNVPLYNFFDRFDGGPKLGLKFSYVNNSITYDVSCWSSKYSQGKIEDAEFQWVYDGYYYPSPNASSEISFIGVIVNMETPFRFSLGPLTPFWSVGAGFIYYKHEIKNMVFPGQSIPPLDFNFTYSPDLEKRTSFSVNFGLGVLYEISPRLRLALNCKYYIIFGYLRPMESWLMEKVSPMQSLDVGLDLTYFFSQ